MIGASPTVDAAAQEERPAGLLPVLAAAAYDGVITLAILFLGTALALLATGGEAIPPGTAIYNVYLLALSFPYFGWCWVRGGNTLGMRAWGLRIRRADGRDVTWSHAVARYFAALLSWSALGLGFLWMAFDRERCSWHDRISGTRLVRIKR